jgi:hypothetical protein
MELPEMVVIEYDGELVALVSAERVHIISPRLASAPVGDPDLRFVAFMCLCCGEVLRGHVPGPYTQELGELWARQAVAIDDAQGGPPAPGLDGRIRRPFEEWTP